MALRLIQITLPDTDENSLQELLAGQKFVNTLWQINVQGQSPDGSTTRIEVVETKTLASGY